MLKVRFFLLPVLLFICSGSLSLAAPKPQANAEQNEFFESKIRPLLSSKCFACHGAEMQMAKLNLATAAGFFKGGESGPVVVKGEPENSRLINAVNYQGQVKMPPTGKLKDAEIADLVAWIKIGAPWPNATAAEVVVEKPKGYQFTEEQKKFWAFQPVKDSAPPKVKNLVWSKSPVDQFILAELEKKGLPPARPASKLALLRRATFDLTGLPPTETEIQDFLADRSPNAFAKVVDHLLASPRYGERWGRHWLDVVRYADSAGADEDIRYPFAYRYRDYVLDAFNKDLAYDEFIKQQLAGDLLPTGKPGDVNTTGIIATGFFQVGPKLLAEQDKPKMVYDMVDEQLDVATRAFMGLTVACARCHDHKFDPIPTRDYYSLASIFASTKSLAKVEGTVSQLYFAPLVTKEVADRYNAHQDKVKAKQEEIDEVTSDEADRHAAALRIQMEKYLPAAWQYENRPGSMADLKLADYARQQNLDAVVLERWITYLKPSIDVRPHLKRWYEATDSATAALSRSETQQKLPEPPATLAEVARSFQEELKAVAVERIKAQQAHKTKVAEARRLGMPPPERINLDVARQRFLTDVTDKKGPLALPENEPEKLFAASSVAKLTELRKELDALKAASPPEPPMACAVTEGPSVQQKVFIRGNWANPGEDAPKQFLRIIAGEHQTPVTTGSGRLELAEWLTRPDHPLTSRVMVNRLWQWHFGEGLVRTPSNFGKLGEMPTHPELLDYLARQFVKQGWSMKAMHRLIMLSSTYQMSSEISSKAADLDPDNRLLSHMNRRRLDAEEIRDGMLALTGQLDFTMGGTLQSGFGTDGENSGGRLSINPDTSVRRTVYLPIRRSNLPSLFNLFDFGDATTPGEGRARTNVSPQALYMMNGEAVGKRSRELARALLEGNGTDDQRVALAYQRTLGRAPTEEESRESLDYLESYRSKSLAAAQAKGVVTTPVLDAWQSFCRVLLSSNEFIYVD
jgi:Protein of unknown function (DUF1553)/Protein of unknown function (DUF1549)/Planctomycete cytochrome C